MLLPRRSVRPHYSNINLKMEVGQRKKEDKKEDKKEIIPEIHVEAKHSIFRQKTSYRTESCCTFAYLVLDYPGKLHTSSVGT